MFSCLEAKEYSMRFVFVAKQKQHLIKSKCTISFVDYFEQQNSEKWAQFGYPLGGNLINPPPLTPLAEDATDGHSNWDKLQQFRRIPQFQLLDRNRPDVEIILPTQVLCRCRLSLPRPAMGTLGRLEGGTHRKWGSNSPWIRRFRSAITYSP